jgi:hypothetical protein
MVIASYDAAITPQCTVWRRAVFAFTVIEGVLEILGISTPSERLQHMVLEYAQIPTFSEALKAAIARAHISRPIRWSA